MSRGDPFLAGDALRAWLARFRWAALAAGALGAVAWAVGLWLEPAQAAQSYLFAYLYWLGIPLGCTAILMLHHLVGGAWGFVSRRTLEAAALTTPLLLVLFLPILLSLGALYPWVAAPEHYAAKAFYLNLPFFLLRAALYFAVWIGVAALLGRWSLQQDRTGDPALAGRMRLLSRVGLIAYFLTVTFAAYDWAMSIEPEWYSSIFGLLLAAGQALTAIAWTVIVTALLARGRPLRGVVTDDRFADLCSLMLVFVMFWAYVTLSQYLIIWSGNIPAEAIWYVHRSQGGWRWPIIAVMVFQFAVPFLFLLARGAKRSAPLMVGVAALVLAAHLVEQFWIIVPTFRQAGFALHWLDLAAPVGIGGLWLAAFAWLLPRRPLLPARDPSFSEVGPAPVGEVYGHG